jgi:H+/Cl- antiporter ClcA/predicted transcriptional regulator
MRSPANHAPGHGGAAERVGDFTTSPRVVPIALLGVGIGAVSAYVALGLIKLIGLFTNLFFFQRWSSVMVSPAAHTLSRAGAVLVPVLGCLIIGFMARYGSERIRGHGIPEALEAILLRGSRIQPRVALLKPLSSAISIGSGGPFGAEGPIIMTGGAFGSIIAQLFHLTSAERKTLLVAGAAGGMSATFASPVAAVVLAVELLLFELKPRSFVPVALASATAAIVRRFAIGAGPIFPVPPHPAFAGPAALAGCALVGLAAGLLSAGMTASVYAAEDFFGRLPIHWMWWPALAGVVIGLGGLVCPQALGVGYDQIQALLGGDVPLRAVLLLAGVKLGIWAISLGSGTSGGVLAPLLMLGAALGSALAPALPSAGAGFWPLVAMGAILGGTMRAPLTAIVFALELTGDMNMMLPLLIAATAAHGFTVLALKRSILTEKMARRGFHISREYAIDALEIIFVREVMRTEVVALRADASATEAAAALAATPAAARQRLFPAVDEDGRLAGVITRRDLDRLLADPATAGGTVGGALAAILRQTPVVAFSDEPLRVAIHRMAESGLTRLPVIDRHTHRLLGKVTLHDVLKARARHLEEERRRERVLPLPIPIPFGRLRAPQTPRPAPRA